MIENRGVSLFVQCLVDALYPEVGVAMVRVLKRLCIEPDCPEGQTCCGQPAFNSGYRSDARQAAMHFIKMFEGENDIVCPSGSCVDMVRNHYPGLFEPGSRWRARAEQVSARIWEFSEYLVDRLKVTDVGARYEGTVTYHDSCHLKRGIGVADQPRALIRQVQAASFVEMERSDACCGFGGLFSISFPEISTAILDDKVRAIVESGADTVVGCDISCLMNIQGRLERVGKPVTVMHIAQLLERCGTEPLEKSGTRTLRPLGEPGSST